ncbi:MAG: hypothetical protein QOD65_3563 [Gaiellales bacterium]|nr:hypothetical protein [Gaiellales bacterium]
MKRFRWIALVGAALAVALTTAGTAAGSNQHGKSGGYAVQALVSDQPGVAPTTDPNLVNGWGISAGPATPWWVSNEGTDTSTLYDAAGTRFPPPPNGPLVVKVAGGPTGQVFNGGTQFLVPNGATSVSARFIFATLSGTIQGWPPGTGAAVVAADGSKWGAVYTGLAIAGDWLYAADFHNARVDIIGGDWKYVKKPGAFSDPWLPKGYSPFGIQNLGGTIYVAYAKVDPKTGDEQKGKGLGIVDAYSPDGMLLARVAAGGKLNAPWGLAWAPEAGFGKASGALLVGNFGDGRINVFRQKHGHWKKAGQLLTDKHKPVAIDGLWGIGFGNDAFAGPTTTLYFAAGPADETHGLYGAITALP